MQRALASYRYYQTFSLYYLRYLAKLTALTIDLDFSSVDPHITMVPLLRGVFYGPVKDWGKGGYKLLLEHEGEEGIRKRRLYLPKNVENWVSVPEFEGKGGNITFQLL